MNKGFKTSMFGFRKKQVIAYLEEQKNEHNSCLSDLQGDANKLCRQKDELEKRVKELEFKNNELGLRCEELSLQKNEAAETVKQKEEEIEQLKELLEQQRNAADALKTALSSQIDENTALKTEYEKCVSQSRDNVIVFENEKNELLLQLEQSFGKIKELEKQNTDLKQKADRRQLSDRIKADPVRTILSYVRKK